MTTPDHYTHTEADAGRYDRANAEPDVDLPDRDDDEVLRCDYCSRVGCYGGKACPR